MSNKSAEAIDAGTVTVPKKVEEIGTEYRGRTDIKELILHAGVKMIGDCAFEGCKGLKTIRIPENVEFIGERAFYGCTSLEKFDVDKKNRFYKAVDGVLYSAGKVLIAYPAGCKEKEFETCDDTEIISDYAFCGNPKLNTVDLGPAVSSVTAKAFLGCKNLSTIAVHEENTTFITSGEGLFKDDGRYLVYHCPTSNFDKVNLECVEILGPLCLADCHPMSSLFVNNTLEEIASDAFGTECRPKKLYIEKDFECSLPFQFLDKKGRAMNPDDVPGHTFRRNHDKQYESIGKCISSVEWVGSRMGVDRLFFGNDSEESVFKPVKVSDTSFDDIAGLDDAKEMVYRHLILPSKHPELFERFEIETSSGVLLYGPPGTGKTMLARAVASEIDAKFYSIKSTDIRNSFVGESEMNIKALFKCARKDSKAVIFFDDFDSLGRERGNGCEPWQSDLIDELLVQMQGLEKHKGTLLVLAATNRPWEIDSALMRSGRFSTHIHVGLPSKEARKIILCNRISGIPHADDIDFDCIAQKTEGFNGADVEELCNTAKLHRVSLMDSGNTSDEITVEDFEFALSRIHSSVSRRDLADIEFFRRTGQRPGSEERYVSKDESVPGYS